MFEGYDKIHFLKRNVNCGFNIKARKIDPECWVSNIICELNELLETPLPKDARSDLIDIIGDLKDQDPHQFWGERGVDY